jgi:hypothetical protein
MGRQMSPLMQTDDDRRSDPENDRVVRWRVEQLLHAGYDGESALAIGADLAVDLHAAVALVRAGCTPDTARRILL